MSTIQILMTLLGLFAGAVISLYFHELWIMNKSQGDYISKLESQLKCSLETIDSLRVQNKSQRTRIKALTNTLYDEQTKGEQIGANIAPFYAVVEMINEGKRLYNNTLANYDLYQFQAKDKPDYANMGGLQINPWLYCDWYFMWVSVICYCVAYCVQEIR